jgi:glutaredoxin 3
MPEVEIYTTMFCPYCHQAKKLLNAKGVIYTEYDVSADPAGRKTMTERAGGLTSVPQIFIDKKHVGGCDDLYELDEEDGLDPLLGLNP